MPPAQPAPDEAPPEDDRIRVLHGASPLCHWTFGYEPVLERLRLLYGDQIKINTYNIPVYEDWDEHVERYGLKGEGLDEWMDESDDLIGLPAERSVFDRPTRSCVAATRTLHAAEAAAPGVGPRLARRILFGLYMEGKTFDDQEALTALAEACGAPRAGVEAALSDGRADEAMRVDGQDMHALGLNFFELVLRDGRRSVRLEHGFDPAWAEEALAYLSKGALKKRALPAVDAYVASHAPVTRWEVERVFALTPAQAEEAARPAEKAGKVVRKQLRGHPCWMPA